MTDLTGTKWRFHTTLDFSALNAPSGEYYRVFSLNFTDAKDENCTQMNFERDRWSPADADLRLYFGLTRSAYNYGRWETLRDEITISGGADATNPTLIEFITSNAEPYDFYRAEKHDLIAVADAIRAKGGTSEPLEFPSGFVTAINDITTPIPSNYGRIEYDGSILTVS